MDQPPRLAEVSRLAHLLADRIYKDHMVGVAVPGEHMSALVAAGLLLEEYSLEVPPLLAPVMDQLRARAAVETMAS
ncbi:conserved hypothetical protein [Methylobacterium sp. 4-46]|uniref:hypothetical protein n=1 Tax=unclassified Methylobacterium TaxID=2615210 RepID=UPI000165C8DA|nr:MULTISPECIES: hypothetical protein [Methylobacterium]ACA15709.1 conserved hypothetical protein [Methylobacterium sp. 4-46]WFT81445.1 hypothetical protein QA634_06030 [Methylobacterium nodulans]